MNNKKFNYEEPKLEIITFSAQDIITISNPFEGDEDPVL